MENTPKKQNRRPEIEAKMNLAPENHKSVITGQIIHVNRGAVVNG